MDHNSKRHSACDECRKRKLKCSGQSLGCTRCVKQTLTCHYSVQKQMGRPRKRQKLSDVAEEDQLLDAEWSDAHLRHENGLGTPDQPVWSEIGMVDPNLFSGPMFSSVNSYAPLPSLMESSLYEQLGPYSNGNNDVDSNATPLSSSPTTPCLPTIADSFPSTLGWSDYPDTTNLPTVIPDLTSGKRSMSNHSTMPQYTLPLADGYSSLTSSFPSSSLNALPVVPSCTCLPDLYLTLSNLATLPSQPINSSTIEALQTATHTAHSVLYCPTCPQHFRSGVQNVMLLATLLSVIADGWSCLLRAPAQDLARGFGTDSDLTNPWTDAKEAQWKFFAHHLIRQYVFGDAPPPGVHHLPIISPSTSTSTFFSSPPSQKPPIIVLQYLCDAMERRQSTWHRLREATGEFALPRGSIMVSTNLPGGGGGGGRGGEEGRGSCGKEEQREKKQEQRKEYTCLTIVDSVRTVLKALDKTGLDHGERSCGRLEEILGR